MTNDNDLTPVMWSIQHATDRMVRGISATVTDAARAIATERRRCALERQLNALSDSGMTDIGIVRGQVPAIASAYPDAPRFLRRMTEHLGIAPEALLRNADLHRELEWNCVACSNRSQCRRWLKSPRPAAAYRSFCPNAEGLDRLAAAQAAGG